MPPIDRNNAQVPITIPAGAAVPANEATPIDFRGFAGGAIHVPSAWTAANLGFRYSLDGSDTWLIARKKDGSAIEISGIQTAQASAYELPPELFGFACALIPWSKSATIGTETDVNQGAQRILTFMLKG